MQPLSLYARSRIVHINLNACISGLVSLIISAQIVYTSNFFIKTPWLVVLFSYAVDGIIDFLVFGGLHLVLYHARSGVWSFSANLAKDLRVLQTQRLMFTFLTFIVSGGLHYILMESGFGRTRAFLIAYAIGLLTTRVAHTIYGLKKGVFEPITPSDVQPYWKKLSPRTQAVSMVTYLLGILLIFVGIALLVLPGPGVFLILLGIFILASKFMLMHRLFSRMKRAVRRRRRKKT